MRHLNMTFNALFKKDYSNKAYNNVMALRHTITTTETTTTNSYSNGPQRKRSNICIIYIFPSLRDIRYSICDIQETTLLVLLAFLVLLLVVSLDLPFFGVLFYVRVSVCMSACACGGFSLFISPLFVLSMFCHLIWCTFSPQLGISGYIGERERQFNVKRVEDLIMHGITAFRFVICLHTHLYCCWFSCGFADLSISISFPFNIYTVFNSLALNIEYNWFVTLLQIRNFHSIWKRHVRGRRERLGDKGREREEEREREGDYMHFIMCNSIILHI